MNEPQVTRYGMLDMQVCVPKHFTDKQVLEFAESAYACGTKEGWSIRKEGDPWLAGDPERKPCDERKDFVHIMLDA